VFPRALLPQVNARPELAQTGVYLLLGPRHRLHHHHGLKACGRGCSGIIPARAHTMISLIEQHRPEVAALCSRFGVQTLDVFGSAADGAFDATRSDIDFLVAFSPEDKGSLTATSGCTKRWRACFTARLIWCLPTP
jgi:predicted nucleotidyltransferase